MSPLRLITSSIFLALTTLSAGQSHASGPMPETSVALVREAEEGGSIKIKNADPTPVLLTTTIENIAEDDEDLVVATPPVARLEPGETQLVRFILTNSQPLTTQRLKRVIFEGIPEISPDANTIQMTVRQNLPMVILPKGVPEERAPWTKLRWHVEGETLSVENPSPYVVRLDQTVQVLPAKQNLMLPKPYILPGESLPLSKNPDVSVDMKAATQVRLFPATVYGYMVDSYDAALE